MVVAVLPVTPMMRDYLPPLVLPAPAAVVVSASIAADHLLSPTATVMSAPDIHRSNLSRLM